MCVRKNTARSLKCFNFFVLLILSKLQHVYALSQVTTSLARSSPWIIILLHVWKHFLTWWPFFNLGLLVVITEKEQMCLSEVDHWSCCLEHVSCLRLCQQSPIAAIAAGLAPQRFGNFSLPPPYSDCAHDRGLTAHKEITRYKPFFGLKDKFCQDAIKTMPIT